MSASKLIYFSRLGQWLNGLRSNRNGTARTYKELTDEQIARLDAIGMIWVTKYEKQWNDAFQALCDYYQRNGTFEIPVSYKTESGIQLGRWIRRQRDFYEQGRLTDEHIKKLRNIGFALEKSNPWEEKYQLAKAYLEEHGNLNVPAQYVVNGVWLSKWLNEQKLIAEGKRKKRIPLNSLQSWNLSVCDMGLHSMKNNGLSVMKWQKHIMRSMAVWIFRKITVCTIFSLVTG